MKLIFVPPNRRLFDRDGLMGRLKAGIDGMADAWEINDVRFGPITIDIADEPLKPGKVIVIVG